MLVTALPGAAEDSRVKVSRSTRPFGGEEAEEGDSEEVEKEEEMGLKLEDTSPSFKASISEATLSTGDSGELGYIIIDDLLMGDMARWMNSFSCIGSLLMDELKREKMTLFAVSSALVGSGEYRELSVGCEPPKMHLLPPNESDEPLLLLLLLALFTALLKETKALSGEKEKVFPPPGAD